MKTGSDFWELWWLHCVLRSLGRLWVLADIVDQIHFILITYNKAESSFLTQEIVWWSSFISLFSVPQFSQLTWGFIVWKYVHILGNSLMLWRFLALMPEPEEKIVHYSFNPSPFKASKPTEGGQNYSLRLKWIKPELRLEMLKPGNVWCVCSVNHVNSKSIFRIVVDSNFLWVLFAVNPTVT